MNTSDWIALGALAVSVGSPAVQYTYHRMQRQRARLELRVGLVGPGQVQVEAFFQAENGHQALFATLNGVRPAGTSVHMYRPGTSNSFTGEETSPGFEDETSELPRRVQMVPVVGGERYRFMFAFVYHGHGTFNAVDVDITIEPRAGRRLGRYRRRVFPIDYSMG